MPLLSFNGVSIPAFTRIVGNATAVTLGNVVAPAALEVLPAPVDVDPDLHPETSRSATLRQNHPAHFDSDATDMLESPSQEMIDVMTQPPSAQLIFV
jgi:hypothetical protein